MRVVAGFRTLSPPYRESGCLTTGVGRTVKPHKVCADGTLEGCLKAVEVGAMTRDADAIVNLLREEIERVGWSEVARRSGIERTALHRAFQARRGRAPAFTTVMFVAEALGVKLEARRAL